MNSFQLFEKLENDFNISKIHDNWRGFDFNEYVDENFKKNQNGILFNNSREIEKVYTIVFPETKILKKILSNNEKNILILSHHAMNWDINNKLSTFTNIDPAILPMLKERNISFFAMHSPLDNFSPYSTSATLAEKLNLDVTDKFYKIDNIYAGVAGNTNMEKIDEICNLLEKAVGHKIKLWNYGSEKIQNSKVAVVAGGGNDPSVYDYLIKNNINVFVTGVTKPNEDYIPSLKAHELAKQNHINLIGTTHYSSEKFACIKLVEYFKLIGLDAEFIESAPDMSDLF